MSPNVYNVSYTHAAGSDQSAARGVRYLTRRPEEREEGKEPTRESEWREIEHTGDKERFIEEANHRRDEKRERAEEAAKDLSRDKSPGSAQYLHVVISPENSERMTDEDFKEIASEWTRDEAGREQPHVGAIHRDSEHDHMHLMIARDKFSKEELVERKEASEEIVRDIERYRGLERDTEREMEPSRNAQSDLDEERDADGDRGRDRGQESRGSDRELER